MSSPFSVPHVAHLADLLSEGDFDVDEGYTAAFDFGNAPEQNPGNPQADGPPLFDSHEGTLDNLFERYINTDQLLDEDSGLVTAAAATAIPDNTSELTFITGLPMEAEAHKRLERVHIYPDARDVASDRILAWQQPFEIIGEELAQEAANNLSLGDIVDYAATQLAREEQAWEEDRVFRECWGVRLQESEDLHLPDEVFSGGWLLEEQGEGRDRPAPWHEEGHDAVGAMSAIGPELLDVEPRRPLIPASQAPAPAATVSPTSPQVTSEIVMDPSKRRSFRALKLVENPYVCTVSNCGTPYGSRTGIRRHLTTVHRSTVPTAEVSNMIDEARRTGDGRSVWL